MDRQSKVARLLSLGRLGKAARVAATAGLVVGLLGPASPFVEPTTASADNNLNWEGIRPPYAVNTGSTAPYASLAKYGVSADLGASTSAAQKQHPIIVAPNGDIFTAGAVGITGKAKVYKSTDGGKSWNQSSDIAPAGAGVNGIIVTGLAVSPKYPSDNVIFGSFSDGSTTAANNGVVVSTNGGSSFSVLANFDGSNSASANMGTPGGSATAAAGTFKAMAIAVTPNFDDSTGAGFVIVAGDAADTNDTAYQLDLNSGATFSASTQSKPLRFNATAPAATNGTVSSGIALAVSPDFSNDGVIAYLYSCAAAGGAGIVDGQRCPSAGTFVARTSSGGFIGTGTSNRISTAGERLSTAVATTGGLGFASDYRDTSGGSTFYAAIGDGGSSVGTSGGAGATGMFKRTSGAWVNLNATNAPSPTSAGDSNDISGMAISGSGSSVRILAVSDSSGTNGPNSGNSVYRSTTSGDSWTTPQFLDGDKKDQRNIANGVNKVAVAPDYATSGVAYATLPGVLGGVVKTSNSGATWVDTGLTNEAYGTFAAVVSLSTPYPAGFMSMSEGSTSGTTFRSLFMTDNLSTTSNWVRVNRSISTANQGTLTFVVPADYKTANTLYAYSTTASTSMIQKSTNGGMSWENLSSDPFTDAKLTILEANSATRLLIGDDKGRVWNTSDGGASWTQAVTVLGNRVTSFRRAPDFTNKNVVFASGIVSGAPEVFVSEDGGVNWKQAGSSQGTWGTTTSSTSGLTIRNQTATGADYHTNKMLYVRCNTCSDTDVWRMKYGTDTAWTRMGVPSGIRSLSHHTWLGPVLYMMGSDNIQYRTWYGETITDSTWNKQSVQSPAIFYTCNTGTKQTVTGTITDVLGNSAGTMWWYAATGTGGTCSATTGASQLVAINYTTEFLKAPTVVSPPTGTSVPTNVGNDGTPTTFTWSSVNRAQCYDVQMALDKDFNQLLVDSITTAGACPASTPGIASNASLTVMNTGSNSTTTTVMALVQGQTYWWRVRVRSIGLTSDTATGPNGQQQGAGPWSDPASFAVGSQGAPKAPQPQLPADGSTQPNLGAQLSWNNPAGTVQYQMQVLPLNNDGPAINLIIGDPAQVQRATYDVMPPVLGQGNYVLLPGATYTWRVRTTNKPGSIGETDPSWGPWSDIRTFKTPRPSSVTIALNPVTPSATPTLSWKDSNTSNFYYEVQLSQDRTFNADPATATAAVYWNLVHGGETNPINSFKTPAGLTLEKGKTYYWRVRQRVQATPLGPDEPGVGFTPAQSFVVP